MQLYNLLLKIRDIINTVFIYYSAYEALSERLTLI